MKEIIEEKIKEIEKRENIRVIYAVESGSRAWGFSSKDSDYDVRFVYVSDLDYYLKLEKTKDIIEWQLDDTLDINGWDVQKLLRLLHSSNPTIFEWDKSPIVYKTTEEWKRISEILGKYFNKKASLYHYLNMAKGNYKEYLKTDMVKSKKYLYVIRPILACKWILDRNSPPPISFDLMKDMYMDGGIKDAVNKVLYMKIREPEVGEIKRIDILNEYIERNISEIEVLTKDVRDNSSKDYELLNEIFLSLVK